MNRQGRARGPRYHPASERPAIEGWRQHSARRSHASAQ